MHALWALSIAMARLPNTPSSLSHPSAPPIRSMPARRPVEARRTRAQNHATTLYIHTHLLTPSCSGCSVRRALRSSFLLLLLVDLLDAVLGLLASHMLSQAATPHHGIDCRWMDGKTWVPVREAHPKRELPWFQTTPQSDHSAPRTPFERPSPWQGVAANSREFSPPGVADLPAVSPFTDAYGQLLWCERAPLRVAHSVRRSRPVWGRSLKDVQCECWARAYREGPRGSRGTGRGGASYLGK